MFILRFDHSSLHLKSMERMYKPSLCLPSHFYTSDGQKAEECSRSLLKLSCANGASFTNAQMIRFYKRSQCQNLKIQ